MTEQTKTDTTVRLEYRVDDEDLLDGGAISRLRTMEIPIKTLPSLA